MQFTPLLKYDRFRGTLSAQLLSSQTSGTFQINNASALGSQLATMPAGYQTTVTIEDEHILLSGFSVSGSTVTCTIATNGRGYNGTSAAQHESDTTVEQRLNNDDVDNVNAHLNRFDDGGIINALGTVIPTITDGNTHVIAGDYTAILTVGRSYLFKVSSTWYRAIIRSASFGAGDTTFEITGDGLVTSGTILATGLGFEGNVYAPVDYQLVKEATNDPADNPPAGYQWLFAQAGGWHTKDSSGNIRFLCGVQASVSSASNVVALDWSVANVYDTTLTEDITTVTHSNGVQGQKYIWRIKQHASAPKSVTLAGKTRYSNTLASYTMTATVDAFDILEFLYNSTDDKYDLVNSRLGFQASPVATTPPVTVNLTTGEAIDGSSTPQVVCVQASDNLVYKADGNTNTRTVAIGFINTNALISTSAPIIISGVVGGFTGLTEGAEYFVSDTAGSISPVQSSSCSIPVGKAISETQILINFGRRVVRGTTTFTSVTTSVVTTGFYPSEIRINAAFTSDISGSNQYGSVGDDTNRCIYGYRGGGGEQKYQPDAGNAWRCYYSSGPGTNTGTVSAKSVTGFTLNCTAAPGGNSVTIHWTAYS